MCFSAEASFVTAVLLAPAGAYCARIAWKLRRDQFALAITPFIFGIQQFCEGLVWLGLRNGDVDLTHGGAIVFLFFALAFWPGWIPFAAWRIEQRRKLRRGFAIVAIAGFGLGVAAWLPLGIRPEEWLSVGVAGHSIRYEFESLIAFQWFPRVAWQIAYVVVVSVPLIVAENAALRAFGFAVLVSAIVTHVAFSNAFVSIWCAFAAVLSAWLCATFWKIRERTTTR